MHAAVCILLCHTNHNIIINMMSDIDLVSTMAGVSVEKPDDTSSNTDSAYGATRSSIITGESQYSEVRQYHVCRCTCVYVAILQYLIESHNIVCLHTVPTKFVYNYHVHVLVLD